MKYPFSDLLKYRSMKELDDQKQYGSKQMVQYKSLIEHSPFNKIILKNIRFNIITQNRIFFTFLWTWKYLVILLKLSLKLTYLYL